MATVGRHATKQSHGSSRLLGSYWAASVASLSLDKGFIVSAASDLAVASHATANRLCGRDRRFINTFHNPTTYLNNFMSRAPKWAPTE